MKEKVKHSLFSHGLVLIISVIVLSVVSSCKPFDDKYQSPQTEATSTYHLKLSNGYRTSNDYPLTEELADSYLAHLNSCPIPLKIRTYEEYKDQYLTKVVAKYDKYKKTSDFAGENVSGQHVRGFPVDGWPNYFLFLEARPNPHEVMGTYFHELGHYECNTMKCPYCISHGHKHVTELHAIVNELESTIEYNYPKVMKSSFDKYKGWLRQYDKHQEYADAVLQLQSSPFWDDVTSFSEKHGLDVPIFEKPKGQTAKLVANGKTITIRIVVLPAKKK